MEPSVIGKKYNKVADWWNERHLNSEYGMKQIRRAISYCNSKRIALDVGCGAGGRIIHELENNGFEVEGFDVSQRMVELARANHPQFTFEVDDITNIYRDSLYDFIIAWDSTFHLPESSQAIAINNMCSLLETEGILVYTLGDMEGDFEDNSFSDGKGGQYGDLENDAFGYGSLGITKNLELLITNGCKLMHLELDQYPDKHAYIIAKKIS